MPEAFIAAVARTAGGRRGGQLSGWHPADLAAQVLDSLLQRCDADPAAVDDVIMGCVGQVAEQACNIARNAVLASRLPESVPATSVDRQCGSSQQALHFAAQAVMSGSMDVVIAAGVESMSRVPMGLGINLPQKNGFGFYVSPAMAARYPGVEFSQFAGAEAMAQKYDLSKDMLDAFAFNSHAKAILATRTGAFADEIVPVAVRKRGSTDGEPHPNDDLHRTDEGIRYDVSPEKIRGVKLILENGRLSAATASQIADGASAVLVVNEEGRKKLGVEPLARIHHMTVIGHDPVIMLEAPIPATQLALRKAGLRVNELDLYEVNEAFASVPLAWLAQTGADPERLNVHGGAIALGHPLGASGTRLATTLVNALRLRGGRYGLQTMCEGGGLANVTIIERL